MNLLTALTRALDMHCAFAGLFYNTLIVGHKILTPYSSYSKIYDHMSALSSCCSRICCTLSQLEKSIWEYFLCVQDHSSMLLYTQLNQVLT